MNSFNFGEYVFQVQFQVCFAIGAFRNDIKSMNPVINKVKIHG